MSTADHTRLLLDAVLRTIPTSGTVRASLHTALPKETSPMSTAHLTRAQISAWAQREHERGHRGVYTFRLDVNETMETRPIYAGGPIAGPAVVELVVFRDGGWSARPVNVMTPASLVATLAEDPDEISPRAASALVDLVQLDAELRGYPVVAAEHDITDPRHGRPDPTVGHDPQPTAPGSNWCRCGKLLDDGIHTLPPGVIREATAFPGDD